MMRRQGKTPKNHHRDNLRAIREMNAINQLQRELHEKEVEVAELKKRSANVIKVVRSPVRARPENGERNFLRENISKARATPAMEDVRKKKEAAPKYKDRKGFGEVPDYLQGRKDELAAEYEAQRMADMELEVPEGMRILPEEERLATMEILKTNRDDVEEKLQSMPFIVETPSQITFKANLESRLKEIEEAERLFSRPVAIRRPGNRHLFLSPISSGWFRQCRHR